ncbi:uncharacterized protein [Blastocystis hominis]|uniref:PHD-type domain-containing protein n=1 Tax=Blastocystis hominis TaxID=12968 RepID=D8M210_BLAHO|nr:uncharacterized protein [Blastocystis hominis]CBK22099.2 unnamed protein product [Blastocystis hominis]|eukprot:XP_012896147.1 uncharacterized protein [Blastocystis hominis]
MERLICAECNKFGVDIVCFGKCHRAFHQACLPCTVQSTRRWICPDCEKEVHRCHQCKEFASDKDLIQCQATDCYLFFHPSCVPEQFRRNRPFLCPAHCCSFCRQWEDERDPLLKCAYCCKSYHEYCLPLEVFPLSPQVFLCASHRFEDSTLPPLSYDLLVKRGGEQLPEEEELPEKTNEGEIDYLAYYKSQSLHSDAPSSKRLHQSKYVLTNT